MERKKYSIVSTLLNRVLTKEAQMEDIIKNLVEKISSYDILNNLFPGVIFCSIVERTTRITFSTERFGRICFYIILQE